MHCCYETALAVSAPSSHIPPILDCSHIFPKGKYPEIRFDLDNVMVQCRTCHEWYGNNPKEGAEWVRTVISQERYKRLETIIMYRDPTAPIDLPAWERYLKQAIQRYSNRRFSYS